MGVAVITGASSGIGKEFARKLKSILGVKEFWFIARREEEMKKLSEELRVRAKIISADLCTNEGIEKVRSALEAERPKISHLINAAGFGDFGSFDEISETSVVRMIDLNVKALVLITHMAIPDMTRGGHIIEMGSGSCFTPLPYFNVYSSSKTFVLHYTKALNYEIKKYGITATCFCPGWVKTEFIDKALQDGNTTHPKNMRPLLEAERVVEGCIRAAERGKRMYVVNWFTKLQHVLFKLLPDCILSRLWLGMLEHPEDKKAAERRENTDSAERIGNVPEEEPLADTELTGADAQEACELQDAGLENEE